MSYVIPWLFFGAIIPLENNRPEMVSRFSSTQFFWGYGFNSLQFFLLIKYLWRYSADLLKVYMNECDVCLIHPSPVQNKQQKTIKKLETKKHNNLDLYFPLDLIPSPLPLEAAFAIRDVGMKQLRSKIDIDYVYIYIHILHITRKSMNNMHNEHHAHLTQYVTLTL